MKFYRRSGGGLKETHLTNKTSGGGRPESYHDYYKHLPSLHVNREGLLMLKHMGGIRSEEQEEWIVIPDQEGIN